MKFFCEELKDLAIISAWSYLWLMKNEESFPVWKVDYLSMFPINFDEFLRSLNPRLYKFYEEIDLGSLKVIDEFIHKDLLYTFNLYLTIWWMPEIVQKYLDIRDKMWEIELLNIIRKLQKSLLESYKADFAKHSWFVKSSHIINVYESVSSQLSKSFDDEVDNFKFSWVIPSQKGFDRIIWPLTWLSKARLVIKNFIITEIEHPLKAFNKQNKFKVFFHDVWLLSANLDTPITAFLNQELWSYKWYIVENYVAQELFCLFDKDLTSWEKWQSEIEFIITIWNNIIPIEVKSSTKSRRAKSLNSYISKYKPKYAFKVTAQNIWYNLDKWYITIPLYLIWKIQK
jgi:predicted AAA+ superfamily ATPase